MFIDSRGKVKIEDLEEDKGWNWEDVLCGREPDQCELQHREGREVPVAGVELCRP